MGSRRGQIPEVRAEILEELVRLMNGVDLQLEGGQLASSNLPL
jgi:hypothetical protein